MDYYHKFQNENCGNTGCFKIQIKQVLGLMQQWHWIFVVHDWAKFECLPSSRSKIWIRARTNWRLVTAVKHVLWWPNYSTWLSTQEDNSRLEWLWRILGFKDSKNEDKIRYYSQLTTYAVKFGYKSKPILRWYKMHEHQYYTTISLVPYMAA